MTKKLFYITTILIVFFAMSVSAQEAKQSTKLQDGSGIEGLTMYPNPVSNGKVYITSKYDLDKSIVIFDVLGKKALQANITSKELNVSDLAPGVYIIRISEKDASSTRKLIVK